MTVCDALVTEVTSNSIALKFEINGIVQGVGFRPHLYHLAKQFQITGEVANTSKGIHLHIEGLPKDISSFQKALDTNLPPLAHITECHVSPCKVMGFQSFTIIESYGLEEKNTLISPDVSICDACLKELFDPEDRRFQYPFINCTNCGPRYTIIDRIPYDRPNTAMRHFHMCPQCLREYNDPEERRFHAQPNACFECGPMVEIFDREQKQVPAKDPIALAASLLKKGFILAIKGLGGFHLAADAENHEAVMRLRQRKHREEKPLAVMSYDLAHISKYAVIGPEEAKVLQSVRRPIVLLKKKSPHSLSSAVSPNNNYFGTMLPYTPLHYILLSHEFSALVMTSGNLSEAPIVAENDEAFQRLSPVADYFLIHNRDIKQRCDDSIVMVVHNEHRLIRRSRGYVPSPVFLKNSVPSVLGCGGHLKATVCLTRNNQAFLSQHIGDLEDISTYKFYLKTVAHMKKLLNIHPEIFAYDLHPDYLSSQFAREQTAIEKIQVQHHHAHIVSCMAENGIEGPVIGLSLDGTGYGEDGNIWGGEILIAESHQFKRLGHLAYTPMPGAASAIKEPWRMAIAYLHDAFGADLWNLDIPLFQNIAHQRIHMMLEMIQKGFNTPLTSSLGRLFDGVAAILGVRYEVGFEGQAAMEMEMLAEKYQTGEPYDYEWLSGDPLVILPQPIIKGIVSDLSSGISPFVISAKFHATLIRLFSEVCATIREKSGLTRVALSGGVFQNAILLNGLIRELESQKFHVISHHRVPTNDGGLSLGQCMVAAAVSSNIKSSLC